ncbi:MAG: hypothetical protein GYB50_03920 [Rhodobacteraceae bacterium]|nr:hypothetical protein [Paracoccaceae bacterium]
MAEKRVSVRFASQGGDTLKAEMRGLGLAGREAMATIGQSAAPAEQGLENISAAALKARMDLESMATKAAAEAAKMRTTIPATSNVQATVMRSTGVTNESGMSAAESLQYGQALDDLRAKINPLYAEIRKYRQGLSEVRSAELEGAISANEAAEAKARLRTASLRAIDGIKGITAANREQAKAAAEAARASEQQAQKLSDLRARYNPIYAEIMKYRQGLSEVRDAEAQGAISANEAADAKARLRTAALQAIDGIKGITAANREAAKAADDAARAAQREAQGLSDLRARYNPVYAATRQYRAALADLNTLKAQGVISSAEYSAALERESERMRMNIAATSAAAQQMSRAARGGTLRMQQMFYQVNDIGVSLAGGMNPFLVMAQQGTQIAQIYGFGNGGVGGIFRDLGGLVRGVATRVPILTAAVALGSIAVAGLRHEINETSDITVSFGDTALAVFQVIGRGIYDWIEPAVKKISGWFDVAWDAVVVGVKWVGNAIINGVKIAIDGISTSVNTIPDMFAVAWEGAKSVMFYALNDMLRGLQDFLSKAATGLNDVFGTNLSGPDLSGIATDMNKRGNDAYVAMDQAKGRISSAWDGFSDRSAETWNEDPMGDFYDAVREQAIKNARKREEDDKKKGGAGGGKSAEKDAAADLIESLKQELAVLRETDPVKKQMLEYSEELADATAEQRAEVEKLVTTLDLAKNGWEAVGRSLATYAEDAKRVGDDIGDALVSGFSSAEDAIANFVDTGKFEFSDLVSSFIADLARLAARSVLLGPIAGVLGNALGGLPGAGAGGAIDSLIGALTSYDGGGHTGYGSRSGGLDGKGGFLAMLHPRERVHDETRGGAMGMSLKVVNSSGQQVRQLRDEIGPSGERIPVLEFSDAVDRAMSRPGSAANRRLRQRGLPTPRVRR